MTMITTMILGCYAWLALLFSRLSIVLRTSGLWILLAPLAIIGLGTASNQAVLIANHDKFPVMVNEYRRSQAELTGTDLMMDKIHCVMTDKTHLNVLADVFDFQSEGICSVGDIGIYLGYWLWVFAPYVWGFEVIRRLIKNEIHI